MLLAMCVLAAAVAGGAAVGREQLPWNGGRRMLLGADGGKLLGIGLGLSPGYYGGYGYYGNNYFQPWIYPRAPLYAYSPYGSSWGGYGPYSYSPYGWGGYGGYYGRR